MPREIRYAATGGNFQVSRIGDASYLAGFQRLADAAAENTVADRSFASRTALATAVAALPDGTTVSVRGIPAIIDSTATGDLSALHDLGTDGVRLPGTRIPARWWTEEVDEDADATAKVVAANDYAVAVRDAAPDDDIQVTLVFEGRISIADPVVLSGRNRLGIESHSAYWIFIAGGLMEANGPKLYGLTLLNAGRAISTFGTIECNSLCGGWAADNVNGADVFCPNVRHFKWPAEGDGTFTGGGIGLLTTSSGSTFYSPRGNEYFSADPEWDDDANFESVGLYQETEEGVIIGGGMGWCYTAIYISADSGSMQYTMHHPFNGRPNWEVLTERQHPFIVINRGARKTLFYNCQFDNGYIDDKTGHLRILGGRHNNQGGSTLTAPFYRIRVPDDEDLTSFKGSMAEFDTVHVGFYTGDWANDFSNEYTEFDYPFSSMNGYGVRASWQLATATVFTNSDDTANDVVISTLLNRLRTRHNLGGGADVTFTEIVENALRIYGASSDGTLHFTEDGAGGYVGGDSAGGVILGSSGGTWDMQANATLHPGADGAQNLGTSGKRIFRTFTNTVDFKGALIGGAMNEIADDAVASFNPPTLIGFASVKVYTTDGFIAFSGEVAFCVGATLSCVKSGAYSGWSANLATSTSNVTGTTGSDGNVTVAAQAGVLKVENRSGGSKFVDVTFR